MRTEWPDHEWNGDEEGHNCDACSTGGLWRCDKVAHELGQYDRDLKHERLVKALKGGTKEDGKE